MNIKRAIIDEAIRKYVDAVKNAHSKSQPLEEIKDALDSYDREIELLNSKIKALNAKPVNQVKAIPKVKKVRMKKAPQEITTPRLSTKIIDRVVSIEEYQQRYSTLTPEETVVYLDLLAHKNETVTCNELKIRLVTYWGHVNRIQKKFAVKKVQELLMFNRINELRIILRDHTQPQAVLALDFTDSKPIV